MDKLAFVDQYLKGSARVADQCNREDIVKMINVLTGIREQNGRIFFLGIGGGASSASHATNDFNKIANIATVCLTDNVGLFTALANDEGWESVFKRQLDMHRLTSADCLFVFSIGGGTQTVSRNLVIAIEHAKSIGVKIVGVVGRDSGVTARLADACVVTPMIEESMVTPYTEDFQLLVNHLLVNALKRL